MQQYTNLHTLGYSIFANFSEQDIIERDIIERDIIERDIIERDIIERDIIERDITMNKNSVWLLIFQNGVKMHVNSCNNINLHTTLD